MASRLDMAGSRQAVSQRDEPRREAGDGFRIELDYTEAELAAYQHVIARATLPAPPGFVTGAVVATGFLVAVPSAWLAYRAGALRDGGEVIVTALLFIAFSIGVWAPSLWAWRFHRRQARAQRDLLRRTCQGAVCRVSGRGIALRRSGARILYPRSTIGAVTVELSLMLVWPAPEIDPVPVLAVPLRLLNPAQREALSACAPAKAVNPSATGARDTSSP